MERIPPQGAKGSESPAAGIFMRLFDHPGRAGVALLLLLVSLFAFLLYFGSLRNEFVWDDPIVIGQQLAAFHSVHEIFFPPPKIPQFGKVYYRPIITLSYVIDRQLDQWLLHDPNLAFHLPVILFHAFNTALILLIGLQLFGNGAGGTMSSLAAAALFAAHPIHTESVCWMAGRSDTLAAVFLLPSLLAYLGWKRSRKPWKLGLSAVLFLGGCLVKESALGFLAIVIVMDLLRIGEPRPAGDAVSAHAAKRSREGGAKGKRKGPKGSDEHPVLPKDRPRSSGIGGHLPAWAALGAGALVYYLLRQKGLAVEPGEWNPQNANPLGTVLNLIRAVGFYLEKIVLPVHLDAFIPKIPHPGLSMAIGAFGLAASAALGWWLWRRGESIVLFLGTWFYAALAPSLAIAVFAISEAPVAERYLYLPSAAFCLLVGWLAVVRLPALAPANSRSFVVGAGLAGIVALTCVYAAGTVARGRVWGSDLEFWKDAVAKSPNEGLSRLHLGLAYANMRQGELAEQEYLRAIDPATDYDNEGRSIALNNLGMLLMGRQELDRADEQFARSIAMRPDYATPHYGIGVTALRRAEDLYNAGKFREAEPQFRKAEAYLKKAIELNPQYVKAHNQLAYLLINTARAAEAQAHVDAVMRMVASGQEYDFAKRLRDALVYDRTLQGGKSPAPGGPPTR